MAGLGLSSMVRGAAAGLNDVRNIQRQDEADQMKAEDRQAGIQEREYLKGRRATTDKRSDTKYERDENIYKFNESFNEGARTFGLTGDASGFADTYNKYYPNGGKVSITRKIDGKGNDIYTMTSVNTSGEETVRAGLTKDQIGTIAMSLKNPKKWLEMMQKNKASADSSQSKQKNELEKIDRKASHDKKLAGVKSGTSGKWKAVTIMNPDFSESVALYNDKTGRWKDEDTGKEIVITLEQAQEMAKEAWDGRDPLGPNFLRTDAMKEALDGKKSPEEWQQAYAMALVKNDGGKGNAVQADKKPPKASEQASSIKKDPAKLFKYLSDKYKDKATRAQIIKKVKKLHPKWEPSKPVKAGLVENS